MKTTLMFGFGTEEGFYMDRQSTVQVRTAQTTVGHMYHDALARIHGCA